MRVIAFKPIEATGAQVTGYLHDMLTEMDVCREAYPAVVVCPGGGYAFLSAREADPVAMGYFAKGFNVFICFYSVGEQAQGFTPLKELSETVATIRKNADSWNVDPNAITVCGFSAGGHLAASLGTLWNHPELLKRYDNQGGLNRPDGMILCYPVILAGEGAHRGSIDLISRGVSGLDKSFFSLDRQVSKQTPPTFIWHTTPDTTVPVENALRMMLALQRESIPFEAHIFPDGGHGMSVCTEEVGSYHPLNARWFDLSVQWLCQRFAYRP